MAATENPQSDRRQGAELEPELELELEPEPEAQQEQQPERQLQEPEPRAQIRSLSYLEVSYARSSIC